MNTLRFRTLIVATVLVTVASLCHLSELWDQTQARVAAHGTWCERTGPHASGLAMWSEDGETWRMP